MKQDLDWRERLLDWWDNFLAALGLVRLENYRHAVTFYHNWLVDIARKGEVTEEEIKAILWNEKDEEDEEE